MELQQEKVRDALTLRNAPYWRRLDSGCSLGYRCAVSGRHSWVARYRLGGTLKTKKLGPVMTHSYSQAKALAEEFFKECSQGISTEEYTVETVCRACVEDRRIKKGERTAHDADKRFKAHVYSAPLGRVRMRQLRPTDVKSWLDRLLDDCGKSAANRCGFNWSTQHMQ